MAHLRCSRSLSCTSLARPPVVRSRGAASSPSWRACAAQKEAETEPVSDPFSDLITYNDSRFDRFFINLLNRKISEEVGTCPALQASWQALLPALALVRCERPASVLRLAAVLWELQCHGGRGCHGAPWGRGRYLSFEA